MKAVRDKTQRYGKLQPLIDDVLQNQGIKLDEITTWKIPQEQLAQLKYDLPGDLYLAGIPISLGTEQLGFVLLSRPNRPFGIDEQQLLKSVENQLDSAILQSHLQTSYQDSMVEIATIYQIDTIRDQDISLDEMLNHVLQVMIDRIKAEMGFIALYDRAGGQLELRASTHQDLYRTWSNYQVFEQVIKDALEQARHRCGALRAEYLSLVLLPSLQRHAA